MNGHPPLESSHSNRHGINYADGTKKTDQRDAVRRASGKGFTRMSSGGFEKIDPAAAAALHTACGEVRLRVETALRSDPQRANRLLARELEVKRTAIASIRAVLEEQGQIPVRPPSRFRIAR